MTRTTLVVYTSRLGEYVGGDGINITRSGGTGIAFAPSPLLVARMNAVVTDRDWLDCDRVYTEEMRESYRVERQAWTNLLALERATLLCGCQDSARCHRTLLAQYILTKLGATYGGELA